MIEKTLSFVHVEYAQTFRVASLMKVTKYDAPPSDRFGMGPHTSKCTKSSGLDSRGMHVGWDTDVFHIGNVRRTDVHRRRVFGCIRRC